MDEQFPRRIGEIIAEHNIELIGADPGTRYGFTQVPNFILTNDEISVGAKLTYAMLLKYAWHDEGCFPGQGTLASDMGAGERSVRKYLRELETAGLMEIVQRGLGKTNFYRLHVRAARRRQKLPVKTGNYRRSDRQIRPVTLLNNTQYK